MTNLSQQLEDKKKGCKEQIEKYDLILKCGDWIPTEFDRIKVYCPQCQAEIAILEKAIAEKKKQRQEEIKFLEELTWVIVTPNLKKLVYNRIEQLNQLKEEQ